VKESKQPTPPSEPSPKDKEKRTPAKWRDQYWQESYLRILFDDRIPPSIAEAKGLSMECLERAKAVARLLGDYFNEAGEVDPRVTLAAVETIDDLCHFGANWILDFWDDEQSLIHHGWTPPKAKEGQP
jgi:hypothetical protein